MRVLIRSLVVVCFFFPSVICQVAAQEGTNSFTDLGADWAKGVPQPGGIKSLMLVDPSRLTVSHSLMMSYGMGSAYGANGSSLGGLFLNHIDYRIADPVHVWVDVGVGFQPGLNMNSDSSARLAVPGFGLLYQPSDHFRFEVIVQNPSYYYNPYNPYGFLRR